MRVLLDTHILLWWLSDDRRLPPKVAAVVARGGTAVFVSAVSVAEISIKSSLGKLVLPNDLLAAVSTSGFSQLPFTAGHAIALQNLPWHHRDPFDRMLISQAMVESLVFASVDPACAAYEIEMLR